MCGITGWASFHHDARPQTRVIEAMAATLAPRGPDAGGVWLGEHAAIGHRRLAVIDLEGGAQPMPDRPGAPTAVLSYSGEVYNHHELRAELRGRGHDFRTRSDTEVVLRAYAEWGEDLAEHLDGMFAFAVWDERAQRLLLVRDRLGVKPLFWAAVDGGLAFASEPKALFAHPELRPRVDADGLREAYSLLFNTGPTVWSGVREVEPGSLLVLDRDGIRERRYWQLEIGRHTDDREATVERVGQLVGAAARSQLEADVPLCSLLSGGIDSTVLTALLADELRLREGPDARIRSYAVDYSDQAEQFTGDVLRTGHDTPYATEAGAFIGTDHSTVVLDPRSLLDLEHRRAVVVARDSPIGVGDMDTSLYLLFGEIRRHSTVALSGEAADEVFGGYPWFHNPKALNAGTFPWLLVTGDEGRALYMYDLDRIQRTTTGTDTDDAATDRAPGGPVARGIGYVLPAVGSYRLPGGTRMGGLSLDRSTTPDSLVASESVPAGDDRPTRLWRYSLSDDPSGAGLLTTGPYEAYETKATDVRGVLSYRDRWYLARAAGEQDGHGTLWRQDPSGAQAARCGTDETYQCWSGPAQSLSHWEETGEVWSQSGRVLFSLPLHTIDRALD
ncbi:asparagine synthase (glutamine-hydrolyzing) [Streptomyces sp. KR55]|uniref:asparagine synthase (glutamine-hydrolyzing) n=1 Tax=Streptomyces sp. KR55 TaxID=3457425 RepID=UPI003FD3D9A4